MQIKGNYYESNKSQKHEALLFLTTDNRVSLKSVESGLQMGTQNNHLDNIEVSPRIANTPRTITFLDGSIFETLENNEIDEWLKTSQSHNSLGWIHHLESKLAYVLLTLVFVTVFSWGFIQYGVPVMADSVAKVLPNEVNTYLGKGTLVLLDKTYFSESELSKERQFNLLTKFNHLASEYQQLNIKVVFRHGGDIGANAFALPDGHIIFTDEMVELSEDDNELMAIFGHEIGHLEHRHLLRRVIQDSLLASLVVLISGDISYASSAIIALPALLLELSYSRHFEVEADQFALDFLNEHEIPPNHFAHIMLRLSEQETSDDTVQSSEGFDVGHTLSKYMSTHPVTQERVEPFLSP